MHINEIRPSKEPKLQKKKNKIAGLQKSVAHVNALEIELSCTQTTPSQS